MWSSKRLPIFATAGLLMALAQPGSAAVDLAALRIVPVRGQSADQTRRDRYECHNWAVDQTGVIPLAQPGDEPASREERAERVGRVVNGASIGAALGGLIRSVQHKDSGQGLLAGAAVGAAVGAATGRSKDHDGPSEAENDYLRALSACLEGRGYQVALPDDEE